MPRYKDTIADVERNEGIKIHHGCYVAHCKAIASGQAKPHLTRNGTPRVVPCPTGPIREAIFASFSRIGLPDGKSL